MKQQTVTRAIILSRTDFQEADRILTALTDGQGKVRVIAKGVRRSKSKMAGGIELLSINEVTILPGRGELYTLISSRQVKNFSNIVKDINRTLLAYELLKRINRATQDAAGEEYFNFLEKVLDGLDDTQLDQSLAELWFNVHLLGMAGHAPNLSTDAEGKKLGVAQEFAFDIDSMSFCPQVGGQYRANHVKFLRIVSAATTPRVLRQVKDALEFSPGVSGLIQQLLSGEHGL